MNKLKAFWKKHKKAAALIAGLIGTPLAGAVFLITDHTLSAPVQVEQTAAGV